MSGSSKLTQISKLEVLSVLLNSDDLLKISITQLPHAEKNYIMSYIMLFGFMTVNNK